MKKFPAILPVTASMVLVALSAVAQEGAERGDKPGKEFGREDGTVANERLARMKNEIGELRRAGKNEEAERLANELERAWNKHRGNIEKRPQGEATERFHHLMEAIKHLHAAGMIEQARHLEHAAREMREHMDRQEQEGGDKRPRVDQASVQQVQREMNELREQMQKLAREMEQLREHLQHDRPDKKE
jgi:hypothetical protein